MPRIKKDPGHFDRIALKRVGFEIVHLEVCFYNEDAGFT